MPDDDSEHTRLRAESERLRTALQEIATKAHDNVDPWAWDEGKTYFWIARRAKAALEEE